MQGYIGCNRHDPRRCVGGVKLEWVGGVGLCTGVYGTYKRLDIIASDDGDLVWGFLFIYFFENIHNTTTTSPMLQLGRWRCLCCCCWCVGLK